jgi:hypothetical protein
VLLGHVRPGVGTILKGSSNPPSTLGLLLSARAACQVARCSCLQSVALHRVEGCQCRHRYRRVSLTSGTHPSGLNVDLIDVLQLFVLAETVAWNVRAGLSAAADANDGAAQPPPQVARLALPSHAARRLRYAACRPACGSVKPRRSGVPASTCAVHQGVECWTP